MATFIEVVVRDKNFMKTDSANILVQTCPVDIFRAVNGRVVVDSEQEDECTLCGRCLELASGKLRIIRNYCPKEPLE